MGDDSLLLSFANLYSSRFPQLSLLKGRCCSSSCESVALSRCYPLTGRSGRRPRSRRRHTGRREALDGPRRRDNEPQNLHPKTVQTVPTVPSHLRISTLHFCLKFSFHFFQSQMRSRRSRDAWLVLSRLLIFCPYPLLSISFQLYFIFFALWQLQDDCDYRVATPTFKSSL